MAKYSNGFSVNVVGKECFLTFVQNIPQGESKITEEIENIVMPENVARNLYKALQDIYNKVDNDRDEKTMRKSRLS